MQVLNPTAVFSEKLQFKALVSNLDLSMEDPMETSLFKVHALMLSYQLFHHV
jgi:hypothetical protein